MDEKEFAKSVAMEAAVVRKSLNNLMGIVNGLVCDNSLKNEEIHFLATWLEENQHIADQYPANIVFRRVSEVLADGVITDAERTELLADLKIISGNEFMETGAALPAHIAAVFDDDPYVEIPDRLFVLTGKFLFGTRSACERAILKRGGMVASNVSRPKGFNVKLFHCFTCRSAAKIDHKICR